MSRTRSFTRSQDLSLTIAGEVEHGELSDALPELKANADGPDILEVQRHLLTDELALVPKFALGRGSNPLALPHRDCYSA